MKSILFFIVLFVSSYCNAQKQGNIWYFGNGAGLDFSSTNPIVISGGATYDLGVDGSEGTSVISDSLGALLFYTNGEKIWNRNHLVMPNGGELKGNVSSTQAALIVPQPNSNRYFYVFTTDDFDNDSLRYGFRYSIVDMCSDNGLGDIVPNQKNIKLLDTVAEKLTAVKHSNGTDYWIITHKYFSDAFYAYHLSYTGIIDTVISHIGSTHPAGMLGYSGAIGQLKASPNGQKLAIVNGQSVPNIAEYFDFNNSTGIVSNCVSIQTNPNYSYYGVSFSPDNSKLYIASFLNGNGIYQFDLNAGNGNPTSVLASKVKIAGNFNYLGLQLANNGKIYSIRTGNSGQYIALINSPNNAGLGCNYIDSATYLNGKTSYYSLPNFIDSYDYSNTITDCSTEIKEQNNLQSVVLNQNSPNPYAERTSINYYLPDNTGKAEILFYNTQGKLIKSVELINKGKGQLNVFANDLSSGIYTYSLVIDGKIVESKKMIKQ